MAAFAAPRALLSSMESLADPTRLRILRLLERHELGVASLCDILQLPQSTVSRHLKVLGDEGLLAGRPLGTSRLYRMERLDRGSAARRLWLLARAETDAWPAARQDALRLERSLRQKRPAAQAFFAGAAGRWDELRDEAYGRGLDQTALIALLPPSWVVADLGCGTGRLTAALAAHVKRVIGIDQSAAMLRAARARTAGLDNVELRKGRLEEIPVEDGSCDAALVVLALSYLAEPARGLAEMARVLRPRGRAVVLDLLRHDREDFKRAMGQLAPGFEPTALAEMMDEAGLGGVSWRTLASEPGATGPALLLATAERGGRTRPRPVS
jgi:ArsR family transcriptional regulator